MAIRSLKTDLLRNSFQVEVYVQFMCRRRADGGKRGKEDFVSRRQRALLLRLTSDCGSCLCVVCTGLFSAMGRGSKNAVAFDVAI